MLVDQFKAIQLVRNHTRNPALAELGKATGNHLRHNTATMCKHEGKLIHCQVCRQQSCLFLHWHCPNVDVPIRPSGGLLHARPHNGLDGSVFATPDAARAQERPLPLDWATTEKVTRSMARCSREASRFYAPHSPEFRLVAHGGPTRIPHSLLALLMHNLHNKQN